MYLLMGSPIVILNSLTEERIAWKDERKGVEEISEPTILYSNLLCDQDSRVKVYMEVHKINFKLFAKVKRISHV